MSIIWYSCLTFSPLFCKVRDSGGLFELLGKVNSKTINKLCSSSSLPPWSHPYPSEKLSPEQMETDLLVTELQENDHSEDQAMPIRYQPHCSSGGHYPLPMLLLLAFSACKICKNKTCNRDIIFKSRAVQIETRSQIIFRVELFFFLFLPHYMLHNITASISRTQR